MELVRKSFILQIELSGSVKLTHFNSKHTYIDLDNEFDYNTISSKGSMYIEGQLIRLQVWTPTFTPMQETPLVPVWAIILELPWHCYYLEVLKPLLASVDKVLFMDMATHLKTRGSVAKVRI